MTAEISRATPSPAVMKIINVFVTFVVERGWGAAGDRLMVLHWTGRISGARYSTPVSRLEIDGRLFTKTRARYKSNFVGGGPAELVLDGERRAFVGTTKADPRLVAERMRAVLDTLGPKHGPRALGLKIQGDPSIDELAEFAASDGLVVIDFEPT